MIRQCPFNIELRLVQTVDLPAEELCIGEVTTAYCEERYLTDHVPDLKRSSPFVLIMPGRKYVGLGAGLSPAWELGKKLIKKEGYR